MDGHQRHGFPVDRRIRLRTTFVIFDGLHEGPRQRGVGALPLVFEASDLREQEIHVRLGTSGGVGMTDRETHARVSNHHFEQR